MTKTERVRMIDAKIDELIAAREFELDSIPDNVVGANYDETEKAIFDRFQHRINALHIERIAAQMPAPKNAWFLSAMAGYIRQADENGGKRVFGISPRQAEIFRRYASGIIDDGKHGRYPSITTGADVDNHLIKVNTTNGYLIVEKYA